MAFELMEKQMKCLAKLGDNQVSVGKTALSFGDNYFNILSANGFVEVYLDRENNKVGFKPTTQTASAYKIQLDKNSSKRAGLGSNHISKIIPKGRYEGHVEGDMIVINVKEIIDLKAKPLIAEDLIK